MKTMTARRKVSVLVLATLMTAGTVFAGASATPSALEDVQAKEKGPSIQMKHMLDDVMCCQS